MAHTETDIAKLRDFHNRLTAMVDVLDGKSSLNPIEKHNLQQSLKSLKLDMKREASSESPISNIVNQSVCYIRVATNTDPINSNWFSDLFAARLDLSFAINSYDRSQFG